MLVLQCSLHIMCVRIVRLLFFAEAKMFLITDVHLFILMFFLGMWWLCVLMYFDCFTQRYRLLSYTIWCEYISLYAVVRFVELNNELV